MQRRAHQRCGLGAALFLHGDTRPAGSRRGGSPSCRTRDGYRRMLSVGKEVTLLLHAASAPEVQGGVRHRLRRRAARLGGVAAWVGDIDSGAHAACVSSAASGRPGPPRDAARRSCSNCQRAWWREGRRRSLLLPGWLAVSRPQPGRAAVGPPAWPRAVRAAAAQAAGINEACPPTRCGTALPPPARASVDVRVIQTLLEAETYCPPTPY